MKMKFIIIKNIMQTEYQNVSEWHYENKKAQ